MKAMIFAAGLGLRLRPLTDTVPKCLIEVARKTLLEHVVDRLKLVGVNAIVINVYHLAGQIQSFVERKKYFGLYVEFSYEEALLDTGGGLKKVRGFFKDEEYFFLHNGDIYSDIDLKAMLVYHRDRKADATLAVSHRKTSRYLRFDANRQLIGREDQKTGQETILTPSIGFERLAFNGIHVLSPKIFDFMRDQLGSFSILDIYMKAAREGATIVGYPTDGNFWMDIGSLEKLEALRCKLEGDRELS